MSTEAVDKKSLIHSNLTSLIMEAMEEAKNGWEVDTSEPAGMYGWMYEVWLKRDETIVDKPTRADILANARSAKKIKAVSAVEQVPVPDVVAELTTDVITSATNVSPNA